MRSLRSRILVLGLCLAGAFAVPAHAVGDDASSCAEAAAIAAAETGVPEAWLQAIALVESGRLLGKRRSAWPWAVNDHGEGHWFARKHEAVRHVERQVAAGRASVDVGCFQVNWRWHGMAFESVVVAFDPLTNARYAAGFLRRLHGESGSWPHAVGRYHSATPSLATAYRARVARALQAAMTVMASSPTPARALRPPRAAGGVALAMLAPGKPMLRQPLRPLFGPVDRNSEAGSHD